MAMTKKTRDVLLIGGIGLGAYLFIKSRAAAAQPVLTAPAPVAPSTNIIGDLLNAFGNAFKPSSAVPVPPAPAPGGGNFFTDIMNKLAPAPAPALAPVEGIGGLGSLSGNVFRKR